MDRLSNCAITAPGKSSWFVGGSLVLAGKHAETVVGMEDVGQTAPKRSKSDTSIYVRVACTERPELRRGQMMARYI